MIVIEFLLMGFLTWSIGLGPALALRFLILRRPIGKIAAIITTLILSVLNIVIVATDTVFTASGTHRVQALIAFAIFAILKYGRTESHTDASQTPRPPIQPETNTQRTHSVPGITFFVLSLIAPLGLFISLVFAAVLSETTAESSSASRVAGASMVVFAVISLYALGLGIAALMQKNKKRLLPILGIVFSGLTSVAALLVLVMGVMEM